MNNIKGDAYFLKDTTIQVKYSTACTLRQGAYPISYVCTKRRTVAQISVQIFCAIRSRIPHPRHPKCPLRHQNPLPCTCRISSNLQIVRILRRAVPCFDRPSGVATLRIGNDRIRLFGLLFRLFFPHALSSTRKHRFCLANTNKSLFGEYSSFP